MQTDWRENSRLPDQNPARASGSPSSSQSNPQTQTQPRPQKNSLASCTSCADLGVECVARSQQFDFSAEDAGLTHARVNGYVESLRRRVAELEQKVNAAEQKHILARRPSGLPEVISPITGKRRRSTEAHIDPGPGTETSLANGDEQSTVEDTMSAIGLLSNKAMAESRVNTSNEPHKLSIIESISAALAVDGRDPSTASTSQHSSLVDGQLIPLTRDLTLSHMQRFINWGVWLPYIDEDHLMEQYNKVLDRNEQIGNPDQAALPHFNTYLAIAIGISMSPDTNRFSALAMNLHAEAVKLLPSILHSQEPLDTLHCMLLLAVFSMFSPSGGSTWHLMGFIMTNCIASGLHKTAIPQARLGGNSSYRVEWLFWTVYLWDRCISSCMGRPFSISDDDISVSIPEAPANDNESDLPAQVRSKLALSRHLLVHAQLTSDICGGKQPSALFSYSNLSFWREFPPTNNIESLSGCSSECLDQLACRAMILIVTHTSSAPTNSLLTLGDSPEIETDTVSSCKRLIERFYNSSGSSTATVSFLDAYTILAAAVIYLCLVQRMPQPNQQEFARTFEVVSKASVLLTQCSTRFAAMNVFQQFLLSLSTKIMEGQGSLQQYLDFIPGEIPIHLRRFVQNYASSGF
ncbi:fungal-specific transcription factor domain-containing protein [Fusarium avenaceum]|nr:fungal-specific transcription factor domain-containing protein [Fusarium avenaceum]